MARETSGDPAAVLLDRVRAGDRAALDELLAAHRDAVRRFLDLRMDARLRGRIDVSDVVQEAQVEIARRVDDYLARDPMPFRVWVLKTAHQQLLRLRRHHTAGVRDVRADAGLPDHASVLLASRLAGGADSPSRQISKEETARRVRRAVAELPDADREVVLLRTFEGLSNQDAARVLDLEPDAASKRFARALLKLRQALAADDPG